MSSPIFREDDVEKSYKTLKDNLLEEFAYDDESRVEFIHQLLADPENPYSQKYFGLERQGEAATNACCEILLQLFTSSAELAGNELCLAVESYYRSHYQPCKMTALIQSSLPLDDLQELAEKGLMLSFPSIADPDPLNSSIHRSPYGVQQCKNWLKIVPKDDAEENSILIKFHVAMGDPSCQREDFYAIKTYLAELLDQDDIISKALNKEKGWIRPVSGKYDKPFSTKATQLFDSCWCLQFKIKLTESGMQNVDQIVGVVLAVRFCIIFNRTLSILFAKTQNHAYLVLPFPGGDRQSGRILGGGENSYHVPTTNVQQHSLRTCLDRNYIE